MLLKTSNSEFNTEEKREEKKTHLLSKNFTNTKATLCSSTNLKSVHSHHYTTSPHYLSHLKRKVHYNMQKMFNWRSGHYLTIVRSYIREIHSVYLVWALLLLLLLELPLPYLLD